MRYSAILLTLLASAATSTRADYAVLRSGQRLHINGYEVAGNRLRLSVEGGVVEVAAAEVVAVEPEVVFPARAHEPAPSGPYGQLIRAAAAKHGLDEKLISRVIEVESKFNARATSRKQALGLMQLRPETAARLEVTNVFDPEQNIEAGTRYLKELLERYGGNLSLALAAYNAGPEVVDRFGGIPPFPETRQYVEQITTQLELKTSPPTH